MALPAIVTIGETPAVPPKVYDSVRIGELSLEVWGTCDIFVGLSENTVKNLVSRTLDTTDGALTLTHDAKRFASPMLYVTWYEKGRMPFVLIHRETASLMALVWFGEKTPPKNILDDALYGEKWSTLAYRSYPPYRGTGFMTLFTKFVLDEYSARHKDHYFWAQIDKKNEASLHFARKIGCIEREGTTDASGNIFMTYIPQSI